MFFPHLLLTTLTYRKAQMEFFLHLSTIWVTPLTNVSLFQLIQPPLYSNGNDCGDGKSRRGWTQTLVLNSCLPGVYGPNPKVR